jgi:hypothetical protein
MAGTWEDPGLRPFSLQGQPVSFFSLRKGNREKRGVRTTCSWEENPTGIKQIPWKRGNSHGREVLQR